MADHAQGPQIAAGETGAAGADAAADAAADAERAAWLEAGRLLFARECRFTAAAQRASELPPPGLDEVAFAGRSNVGKSSLINALTGRRVLARVSNTPGRTQTINFFDLGGRLALVDLPGYGHAQASKARVLAWTRLVEDYLAGRPNLRRVVLLIDCRQAPKEVDQRAMRLLDTAAVSFQVVLTKADKIAQAAVGQRIAAIEAELKHHAAAFPEIIATSARAGTGIERLRAALAMLAAPQPLR